MTTRKHSKFYILLFCTFFSQLALGQTEDAELWLGAAMGKDISKRIAISVEVQSRLYENFSTVDKHFVDVGLDYELINDLEIGLGYRFMMANKMAGYLPEQRYHVGLSYKNSINRFDVRVRSRVQYGNIDFVKNEDTWGQNTVNRNKVKISYDLYRTSIEPFVASEIYADLNVKNSWLFNKSRYVAGFSVNVGSDGELEIFYMLEKEYNVSNPHISHVYGIGYKYDL